MGRRALLAIAMLVASPAHAQDALRGKRLYLDAARIVGSGVSCVDCHGPLPGLFGISSAAGQPQLIELAVFTVPDMAPFRERLAGPAYADLAAYIATPGVPSPRVEIATRLPGGEAGRTDRIEFGDHQIDSASDLATLWITSTGLLPFTITAVPGVGGPAGAEFVIESTDCAPALIMAPGQSCSVDLRFAPLGTPGARIALLGVSHDWVHGVAAVALLGTAAPRASSQPPSPEPPEPAASCRSSNGSAALPAITFLIAWSWRRRGCRPAT